MQRIYVHKSYTPEPRESECDFEDLPSESRKVKVVVMFPYNEIKHWSVITEMWDKRLFGRVRRLYHQEFTESERKTIAKYQTKIHRWYLVTGYPNYASMSLKTFDLINRAAYFFGNV